MIDIRSILVAGHNALAAEKGAIEQASSGHPRVGSSGCVGTDADVYGTCQRKALARSLGIELPQSLATDVMWKAGEANEWHWDRILSRGLPADLKQLPRPYVEAVIEGVPLSVLGHPDVVLGDADGKPVLGLELKGIYGATTAISVFFEHTPKNENLIQAAAYSHFMKLPWVLCYTSASYVPTGFDKKKYGVSSIKPFYRIFYMEWRDDVLWYRDETQIAWVKTVVTSKGIEDYYKLLVEMQQSQDLGPRPSSHYVNGEPHKWGRESMCGLCEFKSACDAYDGDKDYGEWLARIRVIAKQTEVME